MLLYIPKRMSKSLKTLSYRVFMMFCIVNLFIIFQQWDGYYILPSSKHECLAIDAKLQPVEELKKTVQEINKNIVSQEDWLSDTVYVVKNHILEIA